ncbi:RNase P/MRP p29 subunit [Panaeolus papilionaceus]|nr:RNase P/MRP p29 subunit [Panaeolus papilionaceus]
MEPVKKSIDIYAEIPVKKTERLRFTSSAPFTPTYVVQNLSQVSDPMEIYNSRIKGRQILLENPARDSKTKLAAQAKRERRKAHKEKAKLGIIGKKEAKEKGVWAFDNNQAKFKLFLPLHNLWMGYMSELLALQAPHNVVPGLESAKKAMPGAAGMQPKLLKADFSGSIITVKQSKNPALVGLSGIVIHEMENVFKVVTKKDELKVIPKQNSIFTFAVPLYSTLPATHTPEMPLPIPPPVTLDDASSPSQPPLKTVLDGPHIEFDLYGNQFRFRAAERAGRKFKHKETIELI